MGGSSFGLLLDPMAPNVDHRTKINSELAISCGFLPAVAGDGAFVGVLEVVDDDSGCRSGW